MNKDDFLKQLSKDFQYPINEVEGFDNIIEINVKSKPILIKLQNLDDIVWIFDNVMYKDYNTLKMQLDKQVNMLEQLDNPLHPNTKFISKIQNDFNVNIEKIDWYADLVCLDIRLPGFKEPEIFIAMSKDALGRAKYHIDGVSYPKYETFCKIFKDRIKELQSNVKKF